MRSCTRPGEERRTTAGLQRRVVGAAILMAMGCLLVPGIHAQEDEPGPVRVTLRGVVLDALTGIAVPEAAVYLEREKCGVLTDSLGRFHFVGVPGGTEVITTVQFGYEEIAAPVELSEDADIEIELTPRPIMLEGVTAVVDNINTMERRFLNRRQATPVFTRVFDQERMLRTPSTTTLEFLEYETRFRPVACPFRLGIFGTGFAILRRGWHGVREEPEAMSDQCVLRRGQVVRPRVYVDEIPALGGLDALSSYSPSQIYLLEVYSHGTEIRAYTYRFMQRMAEEPVALGPVDVRE